MERNTENKTEKKLKIGIAALVLLCVSLCITSFALAILASTYVRENRFATGVIDIDVSEKNSIYVVEGFAPGMSIDKCYVVKNNSPVDVWYRVCFENVDGGLKDTIQIAVREKGVNGKLLYEGPANDFTESKGNFPVGEESIPANKSREVWITFTFPEDSGNEYKEAELDFDLLVRAVQTKNNKEKKFD